MENFELVEQLKLELIRGYEEYVRTIGALTDVSDDDAREALHGAFCRMLVSLRKRPQGNPILAWRPYIIRSVINELKQRSRQVARRKRNCILFRELDLAGRREVMGIPDPKPIAEELMEAEETAAVLWEEVARLSPRQREVLSRWAYGATYGEIAEALGIRPSTVREQWSRGIRRLSQRPQIRRLAA